MVHEVTTNTIFSKFKSASLCTNHMCCAVLYWYWYLLFISLSMIELFPVIYMMGSLWHNLMAMTTADLFFSFRAIVIRSIICPTCLFCCSDTLPISHLHQFFFVGVIVNRIMEKEKQLSILYQKQGRATQFGDKAHRDKWLQKEIDDLERVLSSNQKQVITFFQNTQTGNTQCFSMSCCYDYYLH